MTRLLPVQSLAVAASTVSCAHAYAMPPGVAALALHIHAAVSETPQNGSLTHADAAIALEIAAGGSASCDAATLDAADVSGDNRVTSLDALMILNVAGGVTGIADDGGSVDRMRVQNWDVVT